MDPAYGVSPSTMICVRLFGPLEVSRRGQDGNWQVVKKDEWNQGTPPRSVFKRLLTTPGRHLSRVDIEDDLWPETGTELADHNLSNALMVIRRIIGKDLVETSGPLCGIADQSQVWTDLDACSTLLREAENYGCTTAEALPLLEEINKYLERGKCLEDESEAWCHAVRANAERMTRQCRIWLAESYERAGKFWQAGEVYRVMTCANPPDEEALENWIQMLARHGKMREAWRCYQDHKTLFESQGYDPPVFTTFTPQLYEPNALAPRPLPRPFDILSLKPESERQLMDLLSRRNLLQGMMGIASTTIFSGAASPVSTDTLPLFAALTDTCRQLSDGNELNIAEQILWTYLPKVELLARLPSGSQKEAAHIASQGYLLAASLVGHRNELLGRLRHSEQALRFGKLADDLNLQVVALRQVAISFDYLGHPDYVLHAYQQALPRLDDVSPLLQACIYADLAGTYTQLHQEKEARRFLDLAYEHFPQHQENEPDFLSTICRYATLILCEGLYCLSIGQPREAESAFARIDGIHPKTPLPERIRLDLLNCQAEAFWILKDLEQAHLYLETAIQASIILGSERRLRESYTLFQQMQQTWQKEPSLMRLQQLFSQHLVKNA